MPTDGVLAKYHTVSCPLGSIASTMRPAVPLQPVGVIKVQVRPSVLRQSPSLGELLLIAA